VKRSGVTLWGGIARGAFFGEVGLFQLQKWLDSFKKKKKPGLGTAGSAAMGDGLSQRHKKTRGDLGGRGTRNKLVLRGSLSGKRTLTSWGVKKIGSIHGGGSPTKKKKRGVWLPLSEGGNSGSNLLQERKSEERSGEFEEGARRRGEEGLGRKPF